MDSYLQKNLSYLLTFWFTIQIIKITLLSLGYTMLEIQTFIGGLI